MSGAVSILAVPGLPDVSRILGILSILSALASLIAGLLNQWQHQHESHRSTELTIIVSLSFPIPQFLNSIIPLCYQILWQTLKITHSTARFLRSSAETITHIQDPRTCFGASGNFPSMGSSHVRSVYCGVCLARHRPDVHLEPQWRDGCRQCQNPSIRSSYCLGCDWWRDCSGCWDICFVYVFLECQFFKNKRLFFN